ncbi:MAG TPA: methyltransferase domain-containing protein [Candidatus Norongarragalinales archaeon]|nr:methyltransferase domain-containing protein [Candidatus Norongarragalinales archaeon]
MAYFTNDYVKLGIDHVRAQLSGVPSGKRALDVGAGWGQYNPLFREKFRKIYAMDENPGRFGKLNDADVMVKFDLDSKKPFPFKEDYFDLVFASNIIEHLHNRGQFETEILRVLKPGGYAAFITPKRVCLISEFDKLYKGGYNGWDDDHVHLYQPRELADELEDKGFVIERIFPCGLLFYYMPALGFLEPLNMGFSILAKKKK